MNEDGVRAAFRKDAAQAGEGPRHDIGEVLSRLHEVKVPVGDDAKEVEDLIEHLPMLGRHADLDIKPLDDPHLQDKRSHLDGFRARAEYDDHFHLSHPPRDLG